MKYGVISCSYLARIYHYQVPQPFDWGAMQKKHLAEFTTQDLLSLADIFRGLGVENMELWWGHSDYHRKTEADGMELAEQLAERGIYVPAYTIGSWGSQNLEEMESAYRYARGLGARVLVGALDAENPGPAIERMALLADRYGIPFAIENHPAPNMGDFDAILRCCQAVPWAIGANLDTGIAAAMGYDPLGAARRLGGSLIHVHAKPAPAGKPPVDFGALNRYLTQEGFGGLVSVEYNAMTDPGDTIRSVLAQLGAPAQNTGV
jgi:sugar phosphate isomerase/epimerase